MTAPPPLKIPLLKGALVTVDQATQQTGVIAFQYNPSTLKRQLSPFTVGGQEGDRSESPRYAGAAAELISVQVQIDATDALAQGDALATSSGIYAQLAALELLIYPSTTQVIQNDALLSAGTLEVVPILAPRTLFVWGPSRVLPVRLMSYSATEELFDQNLNPLRATVSLSMRVLTYSDVPTTSPDYHQFLVYQQSMEQIAQYARTSTADAKAVTGVDVSQL